MTDAIDRIVPRRLTPANRRFSVNQKLTVGNVQAQVTVSFYRTGVPCEVFIATAHPGSELSLSLQDTAVLISVALQHGVAPSALAKSVARLPEPGHLRATKPEAATIIGAVLDLIADLDANPPPELALIRGERK